MKLQRLNVVAFIAIAATIALAAGKAQTFTGEVSDSMCGAKHMMAGKPDAVCTRACVKRGAKFALQASDKMYILSGKTTEVDALAGQKATVTGELKGNTLTVTSIAAAK